MVVDAGIGATNVVGVDVADDNQSVVFAVVDNVVPMIVAAVVVVDSDVAIVPDHGDSQHTEMAFDHFPMVVDFLDDTVVLPNHLLAADTATVEQYYSPTQNLCCCHHLIQLE